jgi:hypothetical protein
MSDFSRYSPFDSVITFTRFSPLVFFIRFYFLLLPHTHDGELLLE